MKRFFTLFFVCCMIISLNACATAPTHDTRPIPQAVYRPLTGGVPVETPQVPLHRVEVPAAAGTLPRQDVYHAVAPGETLWRLSKVYDVSVDDIRTANRLGKSSSLEMGQKLLIPNAAPEKPVIPLYPSKKWKYIIIHHSATSVGDALTFHFAHLFRGFNRGLGYDFVIDNGTKGKADGHIEVSPRWIKQQDGAHCRADSMNCRGIGICLVGNFSKSQPTQKQLDSLVYLVNLMRKEYNIPYDHVLGHGQVRGASTECPGSRFPWSKFWNKLKTAK